mmetsp:Transcript_5823/g.8553  ORF Transcript_5823/g.8553 Transcript_5823/m.8553 type:complete len:277 (+) Transcript_5823:23-853(+)
MDVYNQIFSPLAVKLHYYMYEVNDFITYYLPFLTVTAYVFYIFIVPRFWEKNGNLKYAGWNFFLCGLSVCMLLGMGLPWVNEFSKKGFSEMVCAQQESTKEVMFTYRPMMFWGLVFALSKYFELYDTHTLLRKNPKRNLWQMPLLLHWYHHVTVLVYTWFSAYYQMPSSYIFATMNAFVHCILYYYYGMAEIGKRPSWGKYLTIIQIVQMVIGIYVNYIYFGFYFEGVECAGGNKKTILISSVIMYGSYLYLFAKMAVDRWILGKYKAETKKVKAN